ncbi:LOW QUALITY PROTEIN: uncharacterized protein LOC134207391 [Armigeres subalbatus]|uniref:LOW QUALITY PROTEIN: uncharacterized protein LOC134207391 n=1 Tax=Armigeres subalbatus TaxID=124917 RepID=UPI002ED5FC98
MDRTQQKTTREAENWTGNMVYLEPVDFDQPTQQHPVDVGKCLKQNNVTGYQDIQAIRKFRYRNHNLKCYVPVMLKQTVGLIKGVPFKYEDRELLEELEAEVPIIKVERVLKMDSEKNLTKTKNGIYKEDSRRDGDGVVDGVIENLAGEIILTGDFNARHPLWERNARPCDRGKTIATELDASKLILLNQGQATTIPRINSSPTAIDLSFATQGIAAKMEWAVVEEEFGSAHMCIVMEIQTTIPMVKDDKKKINVTKAIEGLNSIQPQFLDNPEEMQEVFEEKIEEASYVIRNRKANFLKKWWTDTIQAAYNIKRGKLRIAEFKRMVRREKRKYERELKEKIDEQTPPKQIWNIIRGIDVALTGKKKGADHNPKQQIAEEFVAVNYTEITKDLIWRPAVCRENNQEAQESLGYTQ